MNDAPPHWKHLALPLLGLSDATHSDDVGRWLAICRFQGDSLGM